MDRPWLTFLNFAFILSVYSSGFLNMENKIVRIITVMKIYWLWLAHYASYIFWGSTMYNIGIVKWNRGETQESKVCTGWGGDAKNNNRHIQRYLVKIWVKIDWKKKKPIEDPLLHVKHSCKLTHEKITVITSMRIQILILVKMPLSTYKINKLCKHWCSMLVQS